MQVQEDITELNNMFITVLEKGLKGMVANALPGATQFSELLENLLSFEVVVKVPHIELVRLSARRLSRSSRPRRSNPGGSLSSVRTSICL